MKSILPLLAIFQLITSSLFSQNNYWQQQVNYDIQVMLNDIEHTLNGSISITYINNSPYSLDSIVFHLYPNAYGSDTTAFAKQYLNYGNTEFYFSDIDERGYIDSLNFTENNHTLQWKFFKDNPDIAVVYLNKPVGIGDSITLSTPFHVKIPKTFSRSGHEGQSYQISQWYPKPAVFDKNGWHPYPYLTLGEFYSEFGNYTVEITLPENYRVAATGNLQNKEELNWLMQLDSVARNRIHSNELIATEKNIKAFPPSSEKLKTLKFTQENVHDFAWFADKRYSVLKDQVLLSDSTKSVDTWIFFIFKPNSPWIEGPKYLQDAVKFYSENVGQYPYDQVTVVQGNLIAGSGMEYPTITVISDMPSAWALENVIVHEVGHNWFYGILAFNERLHPWLDEGINSYYESRYFKEKYPNKALLPNNISQFFGLSDLSYRELMDLAYEWQAFKNEDQPINLRAEDYTLGNTGIIVYHKTARAFDHLAAFLGQEKFDNIMQGFYQQWKFKHPHPADLEQYFRKNTEKELDWFFEELIPTTKTLDYKITSVSASDKDGYVWITLKNKGEIAAPVPVAAVKWGEASETNWINGFKNDTTIYFPEVVDAEFYRIDHQKVTLDINRSNNTFYNRNIFPKAEPLRLQLFGSLDKPYSKELFVSPLMAWNNYDRWMAGLMFYNHTFPPRNLEFELLPLYSFGAKDLTGMGGIHYSIFPEAGFLQKIKLNLYGHSFHYDDFRIFQRYQKWQPKLELTFRKKDLKSHISNKLELQSNYIIQDVLYFTDANDYELGSEIYLINGLSFYHENGRAINPYNLKLSLQQRSDESKISLEANYKFSVKYNARGIGIRLFSGYFTSDRESLFQTSGFAFNLSGITGPADYGYDYIYLGRSEFEGFLSQQIFMAEGEFKVRTGPFPFGRSDNFIATANINVPIPLPIPVDIFADIGYLTNSGSLNNNIFLEAGFSLIVIPDVLEIYFPVLMNQEIKQAFIASGDNYFQRITFMLNINRMNPFKMIENLKL